MSCFAKSFNSTFSVTRWLNATICFNKRAACASNAMTCHHSSN